MEGKENKIRQVVNDFCKEAKKQTKMLRCPICGIENPVLCNSHSVPYFTLENISKGIGTVDYVLSIIKSGIEKKELGLKQAGCFMFICRDCDSKIFKPYEDEARLLEFKNPQQIMGTIALKNVLRNMYGQSEQFNILNALLEKGKVPMKDRNKIEAHINICVSDLQSYHNEMIRIEDMLCGDDKSKFNLIYKNQLNYVVPLAFQGCFKMSYDLNGKYLSIEDGECLPLLNIAVLPLKDKSMILMFTHEDNLVYEGFTKQFNSMNEDEKIKLVNYLIFRYSDNYFLSKKISKSIYTPEFIELCDPLKFVSQININGKGREEILDEINTCPNFLMMDLAII